MEHFSARSDNTVYLTLGFNFTLMKIERIKVWDHVARFKRGSYSNARLTKTTTRSRVLEFSATGDLMGFGEVVFPFATRSKVQQKIIEEEENYLGRLVGRKVDCLMSAAKRFRAQKSGWASVAFALETAWYDFLGKEKDAPLGTLLNGRLNNSVMHYTSMSVSSSDELLSRLKREAARTKIIQLKLTNRSPNDDRAWITQILDCQPRVEVLLADANGKWSVDQACEVISTLDDPRIIWEEPCASYLENVEVEQVTGQRVMVDQCVGDIQMAKQAVTEGAVSAITVKPVYLGGLSVARDLLDRCAEKGMRVRIDGPWCGDIGAAAVLHLAAGVEPELLIASCDLREPLDYRAGLNGVVELANGQIVPPQGAGLGLKNESLDKILGLPEATYSI